MRMAFVETLVNMAERDDTIVLLTGDLGYTVLEPFANKFPDRFFNVGVAEQNMLGLATGLAASGFTPFAYSISTFASMRPYEVLRNGPLLHELPVRLVGIGGGLDYGHNGPTHYALEDVAIMRAQPDLTVIAPADSAQTRTSLKATAQVPTPIYFRLGKDDVEVPGLDGRFRPGRIERLGEGNDMAIVTYGSITTEALAAARLLADAGVAASVAVAASLAPAPVDDLVELLSAIPLVLTLESHYTVGGVGSLVSEVVAQHGLGCRVVPCGITKMPRGVTGTARYMYDRHLLSAHHVVQAALGSLSVTRG